jgi:hypothetical protein
MLPLLPLNFPLSLHCNCRLQLVTLQSMDTVIPRRLWKSKLTKRRPINLFVRLNYLVSHGRRSPWIARQ